MKKLKLILPLLGIAFSLTSCLKDTPNFNPENSNNVTEFANTGTPIDAPTSSSAVSFLGDLGTLSEGDTSSFVVNISYSGANQAPNDMDVVVDLDQSKLDAFNGTKGASFILPPTSVVDANFFPATVKIRKGEHRAQLRVPAKLSADYDFDKEYAIPLTIKSTSVGVVSGNYGSAIYQIAVRNTYDGNYSVEDGVVTRFSSPGNPANDALSGSMKGNPDMTLVTINAYTVELGNMKWHGGSSSVAGIDNLRVTVDPVTNKVSVVSLGNSTLTTIAGKDNKYDPTTKTFTLNFIWNPTSAARTIENLVLKYKSPRD